MIRHTPTFRAHAEALDALGRSKTPTTALLHRFYVTFAQMVAEIERMPVKVSVGQTVIARTAWSEPITTKSTRTPRSGCAT